MTIKYNTDPAGNIKIITKDGKVSCACCEEPECCMYPAQALFDGLYTVDDLPDSVDIINVDIVNELELNRSGAQYFGTTGGNTYKISIGNDPETPDDKYWALDVSFNGGAYGRVTESECLINYPYPRPDPPVQEIGGFKDQFADTYTVTITGPIPTQIVSLNRVSLCLWEGIGPSGGSIWSIRYFSEDQEPNFLYRWLLDANDALRFKQGPSNTPAGNYDTAYVEEVSVVVS